MLIADLEVIADDIMPQAVVIEVVLGDVLDSCFLFGHKGMIFWGLYHWCPLKRSSVFIQKYASLCSLQKYLKITRFYVKDNLRQLDVNYCQFMDIFGAAATLRLGIAR